MSPAHKITLIGGSGFIGTKLTADLSHAGHAVSIADVQPSRRYPDLFRKADVRDPASLKEACSGSDIIINLAAAHRDDVRPVSLYHDINVAGAENVCRVAEDLNIQTILFTSSAAVYGLQDGDVGEDRPHKPVNMYGETKSKAEAVYRAWQMKDPDNRRLVIVRPTVVFGIGNRGNVHTLIDQVVRGHFIMIGDGQNRKSMAYVDNVSSFLVHCLNFGPGIHVYNYVDKPDLNMQDLIGTIRSLTGKSSGAGLHLPKALGNLAGVGFDALARMTGKTFPISRIRIEKFCATTVFSAKKLEGTSFKAPKNLKEALEETIRAEFPSQPESRAA
jgi:nucleoside-diphosphate-sugar epimerase